MTKYLLTKDLTKCCGCSACEQICPKSAIVLKANDEGFLYPILNEDLCVNCGLCKRICPYDNEIKGCEPIQSYAAQSDSVEILNKSSSGGMFRTFADYILEDGGTVAGCIFDETFRAVHTVSEEVETVYRMQGSKYVQSDMGNTFNEVKKCLENGQTVLFTGTPCQVAGLENYLQKPYIKLYTVDLICHGVPSPLLLEEYIKKTEEKKGILTDLRFRDKQRNGWCSQGSVTYKTGDKNKTFTISPFKDSYYNLYYIQNCVSRMSCYSCPYANSKRVADITIGDYWNANEILQDNQVKDGISAVLVNTIKGQELLENVKDSLNITTAELSHIIKANGNLKEYNKKPEARDTIYKNLKDNGYDYVVKDNCKFTYLMPFIRKHMPKRLKKVLKGLLH